jgi:hypothetical protein
MTPLPCKVGLSVGDESALRASEYQVPMGVRSWTMVCHRLRVGGCLTHRGPFPGSILCTVFTRSSVRSNEAIRSIPVLSAHATK